MMIQTLIVVVIVALIHLLDIDDYYYIVSNKSISVVRTRRGGIVDSYTIQPRLQRFATTIGGSRDRFQLQQEQGRQKKRRRSSIAHIVLYQNSPQQQQQEEEVQLLDVTDEVSQASLYDDDTLYFYDYNNMKCSYRKQRQNSETAGNNNNINNNNNTKQQIFLLIHPIGIGQASWFWKRFMKGWINHSNTNSTVSMLMEDDDGSITSTETISQTSTSITTSMYAINLLGCGIDTEQNAAFPSLITTDTMDMEQQQQQQQQLALPIMTWVQQCEYMLHHVIFNKEVSNDNNNNGRSDNMKVTIIVQGGLAPVGIVLASRNIPYINSLILCSPPTYNDLILQPIPSSKIISNYKILSNPIIAYFVFTYLLETKWAIEYFSNLFLFANSCTKEWIELCYIDAISTPYNRIAIQYFNAGYCCYKSYSQEMNQLQHSLIPILILRGSTDTRSNINNNNSTDYSVHYTNCQTMIIPNTKNVLPYEAPMECCTMIYKYLNQPKETIVA